MSTRLSRATPLAERNYIQLFISFEIKEHKKHFPKHVSTSKQLTFDTGTSNTGNDYPT